MNVQRLALDLADDVARARHQPVGRAPARRGRPGCTGGDASDAEPMPEGVNVDEELVATLENGVLWLTINRADKGNAIPYYVRDRLIAALPGRALRSRRALRSCSPARASGTSAPAPTSRSASRAGKPKPEGAPDMVVGARHRT